MLSGYPTNEVVKTTSPAQATFAPKFLPSKTMLSLSCKTAREAKERAVVFKQFINLSLVKSYLV
jgi:hypothetical protein